MEQDSKTHLLIGDEFVAALVHDLKNPLSTIIGNAEFLTQAAELSSDSREAVADIAASGAALGRIAAELLEVVRGLQGTLRPALAPVDLGALIVEVGRGAAARAERVGVSLALDVELPAGHRLRADRDLIRHLLENLVENALRRAPARGVVTLGAAETDGRARIRVHDPAAPPPPQALARLFAIAGPGEDGRVGRRLALLYARVVCEAHAGAIRADTPSGGGLQIEVELPVDR